MQYYKNKASTAVSTFLILLSMLVGPSAYAGVSALAMELYDVSGLRHQIAMIPAQTERSFDIIALSESMPLAFESLDQEAVKQAVPLSFSEARIESEMLSSIDSVSQAHLQSMVAWFDSELGKKVRQAELSNSLLSNQANFADYQKELADNPASDKRIKLAKRLDSSLGISESAADTLINLQIGFTLSIMSAAGTPIDVEAYAQSIQNNRSNIVDNYRLHSIDTILFIYQDLTDSELSQYVDSSRQGAAREFIDATNHGIANAMLAASSQLGTSIGKMFDAIPTESGI